MTPEDQKEAYCKLKYGKLVTKRYTKMIDSLEKRNTKLFFDDNTQPKEQLQLACKFTRENWEECKKDLIHDLFDVQIGESNNRREKNIF